jgi:chaperonin GroES|tara:strand:+ start:2710 stop:5121 length:2412 start_codon:yes stop_codon:yes gene_type:complete
MAEEPVSLIEETIPSQGNPLSGMMEEQIDIEIEEEQPPEMEELDDGSVVLSYEEQAFKEAIFAEHDANIAELIDERELMEIASDLSAKYEEDKSGRKDWEESYVNGLDLLGIKYEDRDQPFRGSSGVTHPLIAESITQFQAQAYKELLPSGGPVRTQIIGATNPQVEMQSQRVKDFMNYQIMHVMEEYDPEMDRLLFYLPIAGSAFKKVYFDDLLDRAVSKFVPADDLIVPYNASDLDSASRITHVIRMNENDVRKAQATGFYREIELSPYEADDEILDKERELSGIDKTSDDQDCTLLEIHTDLDLPGFEHRHPLDDEPTGIKLPYIVTIDEGTSKVLSVRRNWTEGDEYHRKQHYFSHYKFLPGLGFYGFGLLHMIGGLGRSATSILRQLIDAGTLANLPAGFKTRGIRIRDADEPLSPGEFRDIDVPGGALKESIMALPYKEPSQTLSTLLGFVVDAGRRFAAITDIQVGDGNQQAAPGTTVALLERGSKVMSAIHKRLHYAQRKEFRMLAKIFAESLPPVYPYNVVGAETSIKQQDFDDRVDVLPVSDPNIFSMSQRMALAQTQLQLAQSNPEMHNLYEAYHRMYESIGVQNIEAILPPPKQPVPTDPAIENAKALIQETLQAFPEQDHDAHIQSHLLFIKSPVVSTTPPVFALLLAHICEHVAFKARATANSEMQQIMEQAMQQGQQSPQIPPEDVEKRVAQLIVGFTNEVVMELSPPAEGQEDPLVGLRSKEIDIKAADVQRKADEFAAKHQLDVQTEAQKQQLAREKIDSQEDIALLRAEVNRERIDRVGGAGRGE